MTWKIYSLKLWCVAKSNFADSSGTALHRSRCFCLLHQVQTIPRNCVCFFLFLCSCGWNISLPFFVLQQFSSPPWLHFILAPPYSSFLEIFFSWQNNTTRVVPNLEFRNFERPTNQYDKSNFAWTFEKKFRLHNWTMSSGIQRVYKNAHLKNGGKNIEIHVNLLWKLGNPK